MSEPKTKALFNRSETAQLARRFVKADQYEPKRDVMTMYKLFKQFPERRFWDTYTLGFELNAAVWFLGKDGQDKLKNDWNIFHLDLNKQETNNVQAEKQGEDFVFTKKPKTIADLLK